MKFKIGDVVIEKSEMRRVRKIDARGVWVGRTSDSVWWDCFNPETIALVYRRASRRKKATPSKGEAR